MFLLEVVKSFEADQVKICFKKYESTRRIKIREVSKKISPLSAAMWIEERKKIRKQVQRRLLFHRFTLFI